MNHICGSDKPRRKRNCRTQHVSNVSNFMDTCKPAKAGNTKQSTSVVKSETGMTLEVGQASLIAQGKSHSTAEVQIGQCFWLPSVFRACQEADPAGACRLESVPCTWDSSLEQFLRGCLCLSFAKHFWSNAGIRMQVCDGTFSKSSGFEHIVLVAVTFDGNNQVVTLGIAIVDVENAENWVWFEECLEQDFPGCTIWMSDTDKGIESNAFSLSLSQSIVEMLLSGCAKLSGDNCKEACKGPAMNEEHKRPIVQLGKSRAEDIHNQRLTGVEAICEEWAAHSDARKFEFVAWTFLGRGKEFRRWGKVTSNAAENMNGALVKI